MTNQTFSPGPTPDEPTIWLAAHYEVLKRSGDRRSNTTLLPLLVQIAVEEQRPLSLVEFVQSAFEAGYRAETDIPGMILAALQKLTRQGTLVKDAATGKCHVSPESHPRLWFGDGQMNGNTGRNHRMRPQPLICVRDVEASSRWYQRLLGCRSDHGGPNYERLVHSGRLVLQLHRWEEEHHHGRIGDPNDVPPGNGLLLWFEVDDFDAATARAEAMGAEVVMPRHRNPPDGDGGPNHWEVWLRDLDGYKVVLASPDGTADGSWRPRPAEGE